MQSRTIYPCFDEPNYKVVIRLSVKVRHEGHRCISNSPLENLEQAEDGTWYHFEPTPLMSTYLLTLFIAKYE